MKNILHKKLFISFGVLLFSVFLLGSGSAYAAERVWTGEGDDNKFSTAENWEGDVAPGNGDSIVIPVDIVFEEDCTGNLALENDLDGETVALVGISSTGSRPSVESCSWDSVVIIEGNELALSGSMTSTTSSYLRIDADIRLVDDVTSDGLISFGTDGIINTDGHNLEFTRFIWLPQITGSGTIAIVAASGGTGGGGVPCNGAGWSAPVTSDSPDFTGNIIVDGVAAFWTVSSRAGDIARGAASITVRNGASIGFITDYDANMTFSTPITLEGGRVNGMQALNSDCQSNSKNTKITISSTITLTGETTFYPSKTDFILSGTVSGAHHIKVASGVTGSVAVGGTVKQSALNVVAVNDGNKSSYCYNSDWGLSVLANNKYVWNVDCPELSRTNENSTASIFGILAGTGRIGNIHIGAGGVIAPGNSPGTLSTGNLAFEEGGIYEFEIAGSEAGQYDQINVTGTVNLGNGTLSVLPLDNFVPSQGQSFVIINNDGSDAVEGTFAGLAEGATVEVNSQAWFTISYVGGDGNDVVLTTIPGVGDAGDAKGYPIAIYALAGVMAIAFGSAIKRKFAFGKKRR